MSDANKAREYEFKNVCRVIFTDTLFTPKQYVDPKTKKAKGDPKYSATFLLAPDSADLAALKSLCKEIAKEHNADFANTAWPFKNGDTEADKLKARGKNGEVYRGQVVIRSDTGEKYPPGLAIFKDGNIKKGAIDLASPALVSQYKGWFYSGSNVIPVVQLKWYDAVNEGKPGIKAYLGMVVATNTGERLGGGKPASERFKGVVGQATNEDPTGDLDDEIPF